MVYTNFVKKLLNTQSKYINRVINKSSEFYTFFDSNIVNKTSWEFALYNITYENSGTEIKFIDNKTHNLFHPFYYQKDFNLTDNVDLNSAIIMSELFKIDKLNKKLEVLYANYINEYPWTNTKRCDTLSFTDIRYLYLLDAKENKELDASNNFRNFLLDYCENNNSELYSKYIATYKRNKEMLNSKGLYNEEKHIRTLLPTNSQHLSLIYIKEVKIQYLIVRTNSFSYLNEGMFISYIKDISENILNNINFIVAAEQNFTLQTIIEIVKVLDKFEVFQNAVTGNTKVNYYNLKEFFNRDIKEYGLKINNKEKLFNEFIVAYKSSIKVSYKFTLFSPFEPVFDLRRLKEQVIEKTSCSEDVFDSFYSSIDSWLSLTKYTIIDYCYLAVNKETRIPKYIVSCIVSMLASGDCAGNISNSEIVKQENISMEHLEIINISYFKISRDLLNKNFSV